MTDGKATLENSIIGCLLGTAVADALGLPLEGLSRTRQRRMYPAIQGHGFLFGRGMISDDTEHTALVAQALAASGGMEKEFACDLARRLRRWILALPAGTGWATLRALLKLCAGVSPEHSGVFSAGNGPAMRSAIIGVCFGEKTDRLASLVRISTRVTHTDPKAEWGALAVALAAHRASRQEFGPEDYLNRLRKILGPDSTEFLDLVEKTISSILQGNSTESLADELGLAAGVSGYIYHTLPVALHAWLRHPRDYRAAVLEAIRCGGDTDTVAAIVGGIVGSAVGREGIPHEWLENLWDWPRTPAWLERVGFALADSLNRGISVNPPEVPFGFTCLRNLFFLAVVLGHGFRRTLPPYG